MKVSNAVSEDEQKRRSALWRGRLQELGNAGIYGLVGDAYRPRLGDSRGEGFRADALRYEDAEVDVFTVDGDLDAAWDSLKRREGQGAEPDPTAAVRLFIDGVNAPVTTVAHGAVTLVRSLDPSVPVLLRVASSTRTIEISRLRDVVALLADH